MGDKGVSPVFTDIRQGFHALHEDPALREYLAPHDFVYAGARELRAHGPAAERLARLRPYQWDELYGNGRTLLDETLSGGHAVGYGSTILGSHDFVGATFYIACNMMLAFAIFFFMERPYVPQQWGTGVLAAGIVCFIAFYNYTYMKEVWVLTQNSPTVYRYTDWLITVPIQVMEFYFVLKACGANTGNLATRLMVSSLVMLIAGWLAETDVLDKASGFIIGCLGWLYIVNEVHRGSAGQQAAKLATGGGKKAFDTVRSIVSIGWIIYPLGYALAYIIHGGGWAPNSAGEAMMVNVMYNLADLVNKGAFGMAIWAAAKYDQSLGR